MEISGRRLEQLMDQYRREDAEFNEKVREKLKENGGPAQVALFFKDDILAHFAKEEKPAPTPEPKKVEVETKPVTNVTKKVVQPKKGIIS